MLLPLQPGALGLARDLLDGAKAVFRYSADEEDDEWMESGVLRVVLIRRLIFDGSDLRSHRDVQCGRVLQMNGAHVERDRWARRELDGNVNSLPPVSSGSRLGAPRLVIQCMSLRTRLLPRQLRRRQRAPPYFRGRRTRAGAGRDFLALR